MKIQTYHTRDQIYKDWDVILSDCVWINVDIKLSKFILQSSTVNKPMIRFIWFIIVS